MIEFESKFDDSVTKSMNRQSFRKMWWLFLIGSAAFCLIGILGIAFREDESDLALGIFLLCWGVLFTPLVILLAKLIQRKVNKSMSLMSPDTTQTFTFYPERLKISVRKQRSGEEECEFESVTDTKYPYLYRVEETKEGYIMYVSKMQAHVFKKADLTQGSLEELNDILAKNLGQKFKRLR